MSEQREVLTGKAVPDPSEEQQKLNEEVRRRLEKKQHLRAVILERGVTSSSMAVNLPSNLHGEWIRNEPKRIRDAIELGFHVDREYAPKQLTVDGKFMHDANGDGSAVIGDAIFMVCDKETRDIVEELQKEEYIRRHGKPGEINQILAEEKGFLNEQNTLIGTHIGNVNESRAVPVAMPVNTKKE